MTKGLAFWVIMIIWLLFGIAAHFGWVGGFGPLGLVIIVFVLLALLGWQVFGAPIK